MWQHLGGAHLTTWAYPISQCEIIVYPTQELNKTKKKLILSCQVLTEDFVE